MDHMDSLRERVEALERHTRRVERQARWWRGIACGALVVGLVSLPLSAGTAKNDQPTAAEYHGWKQRVAALEYKLQYVTGGTNEVVITGANLRIVNGLGATRTENGLGNLIVGYNELRALNPVCNLNPTSPLCTDTRTGSHNVVVGSQNNFSNHGGLVVGDSNEISGSFASVSGGVLNTASGENSSVSGGQNNLAGPVAGFTDGGTSASVSGGANNTAIGFASSVSGGATNTASDVGASVSGGIGNRASGKQSWVGGGTGNTASHVASSVSGGAGNTASELSSSVSGGLNNTASGEASSVSGGHNRSAPAQFSWAASFLFIDDF